MEFQAEQFYSVAVAGVPLIFVIWGIVEAVKQAGVSGKGLYYTSLGAGLVLGGAYQMSMGIPVDFAGWFAASIYSLGLGFTAAKVYDMAGGLVAKAKS